MVYGSASEYNKNWNAYTIDVYSSGVNVFPSAFFAILHVLFIFIFIISNTSILISDNNNWDTILHDKKYIVLYFVKYVNLWSLYLMLWTIMLYIEPF
jgi:hypothetical protein